MYNNNDPKVALAERLAKLLSDLKVFSALAQGYHWNVKGPDFKELHSFFGDIYDDVDGSIDPIAENILKLGFDAPYFLEDFIEMSAITLQNRIEDGNGMEMVRSLYETNKVATYCIIEAFDVANSDSATQSIANYLAERLDTHQKWNWQLAATLGLDN